MYWTDWEEDPKDSKRGKIERAWMDGSNRNVFITSKTVLWPNGLSLDIPAKILYWVDAFYDRIEMVYLNGTERKASGGPGAGAVRHRAVASAGSIPCASVRWVAGHSQPRSCRLSPPLPFGVPCPGPPRGALPSICPS